MGHFFMSDGWFDQLRRLTDEAEIEIPAAVKDLVINLVVIGGPEGDIQASMVAGALVKGGAPNAPTTLKLSYDVARKMFVERDQSAAMNAFMAGQIQVEGDMSKLMGMQAAGPPSEAQRKLADRIREMTD